MNEKGRRIIALRQKGKTYGEIEKILKLPKSTVAWWLRNIKISKSLREQILKRSKEKWRKNITAYNKIYAKIRSTEAAKIREGYKEQGFQEISKEIKKLSQKDLKLIGLALYWAEGNKASRNQTNFSNSDPFIIQTIMRFFREICKVSENKIKAKIHLYPQINPKKATRYWSRITGLPAVQFTKPQIQISKASKRRRNPNTLPYGTLHLNISNTELTWKIKGRIDGIIKKI